METLQIRVTRDDIRKGIPENVHMCPIARAVRRAGRERVTVDDCIATRTKNFELPDVAQRFMRSFDWGRPVKPFTFTAKRIVEGMVPRIR